MIQATKNIDTADFQEGTLLLIDKPLTWTSFDVVNKVRYALKRRLNVKKIKVGHSGTLDPMATGLLQLCTGKYTKKIAELQGQDKVYTGTIELGATTPTFDAESERENIRSVDHLTDADLEKATRPFIGPFKQVPPIYSAIKMKGQTAYQLARRGKEVVMEPRDVEVFSFQLTAIDLPFVHFEVACEKGFYVRSLAHDFGQSLGVGGYLTALKRTNIGPYSLSDAFELSDLVDRID